MKNKWNHLAFLLLALVLYSGNTTCYASIQTSTIHIPDRSEEYHERTNQNEHALEVHTFSIFAEGGLQSLNSTSSLKLPFLDTGIPAFFVLKHLVAQNLYYHHSQTIIPSMDLGKLLFPYHFHT